MHPPLGRLADGGGDGGGLQPVERRLQPLVVARSTCRGAMKVRIS